jgi:hypothetical protein
LRTSERTPQTCVVMRFVLVLDHRPVASVVFRVASTSLTSWIPPFGSVIEIERSPSSGVAIGIDHRRLPFVVKRCLNVARVEVA